MTVGCNERSELHQPVAKTMQFAALIASYNRKLYLLAPGTAERAKEKGRFSASRHFQSAPRA